METRSLLLRSCLILCVAEQKQLLKGSTPGKKCRSSECADTLVALERLNSIPLQKAAKMAEETSFPPYCPLFYNGKSKRRHGQFRKSKLRVSHITMVSMIRLLGFLVQQQGGRNATGGGHDRCDEKHRT